MESAKDATNAVKNTVYTIARKGDGKLSSAENKPQEKVADKEPEKADNAEKPSELITVADDDDIPAMERAKSLVDSLSRLGPTTHQAPS